MNNHGSSNVSNSTPSVTSSPLAADLALCARERTSSVREPSTDGVESFENAPTENAVVSARARLRSIGRLPNHRVVSELLQLNRKQQRAEAELMLFLGELDQRQLYREFAVSSTFDFCIQRLGFSEDVAYKRVGAARMIRRFPRTFDLLIEGHVHLTALMLIKPHLTEENHEQWLSWVCGKSKRQVEKLVASLFPRPDAPTSIRRMPAAHSTNLANVTPTSGTIDAPATPLASVAVAGASAISAAPETPDGSMDAPRVAHASSTDPERSARTVPVDSTRTDPWHLAPITALGSTGLASVSSTEPTGLAPLTSPSSSGAARSKSLGSLGATPGDSLGSPHSTPTTKISPLSSNTYRVTFTASERLMQKLERAREMLSHRINPRDLPALLERAIDCLLDHDEKRRFGTRRSATGRISKPVPRGGVHDGSAPQTAMFADQEQASCHQATPAHRDSQDPDPAPTNGGQSALAASNGPRRRRISTSIRRAVFERDGGQCTFLDWQGHRCQQRRYLEFDHIAPHALGGSELADNLRLRCRSHNQLEAERWFGRTRVKQAARCAKDRRLR